MLKNEGGERTRALKILKERIRRCWVPGHSDTARNEQADKLARKRSLMEA